VASRHADRLARAAPTGHSVQDRVLGGVITAEELRSTVRGFPTSDSPDFLEDFAMARHVKVGFVPFATRPRGFWSYLRRFVEVCAATRKTLASDIERSIVLWHRGSGKPSNSD